MGAGKVPVVVRPVPAAEAAAPSGTVPVDAVFVGADGSPIDIGPGAAEQVPAAAHVAPVTAADAAPAAGDAPTKAEFDALAVLGNAAKAANNSIIAALVAAGLMEPEQL